MSIKIENIRNIGVIAHIDAGKTTLTERMLFYTQKIHRMGEVHNGTATMDYMPEEQERGITITAACTSCEWKGYSYNIIDTPGHVDFTIEVERSLRVLDGAIAVFCAVAGVEAQSETVWRQSENFLVPKLIFINKIDRIGADFENCLKDIHERLQANAQAITIPYFDEKDEKFYIIDLIEENKLDFSEDEQGQKVKILSLSSDEKDFFANQREQLLEKIAEADEIFLELFLMENYTKEDINQAVRRATLSRQLVPVFAGSALKNIGVQPLLDGVAAFLPSPFEREVVVHQKESGKEKKLQAIENEEFCALVFKVLMQENRKLAFLRIYSGKLDESDILYNVAQNEKDRVQHIYRLHADKQEQLKSASAGDIVAVLGLKNAKTGQTYTKGEKIYLENLNLYQPVLTMALEPRNSEESQVIESALKRYCEEDPTLEYTIDEVTGHFIVSGMGELHIEILLERLKREYKVMPRSGQAQVIYKEYITKKASAKSIFERELGDTKHYGEVALSVSPYRNNEENHNDNDSLNTNFIRFAFDTSLLSQIILDNALESAQSALTSSENGYALQNILVEIEDIVKKENTSPAGIQMAVNQALREALSKAGMKRIEPIMYVEITVSEEFVGNSISVFSQRSGKVDNLIDLPSHKMKKIQGKAPLSSLFGFATDLRSATQGRAGLVMQFDTFGNV